MPKEDPPTGRHDRRNLIPPPRPSAPRVFDGATRRPLGSHPGILGDVPKDSGAYAEWMANRLAMVDARGEQTHDVVIAIKERLDTYALEMRAIRSQEAAQAAILSNIVETVGAPANDATGRKGSGMAGQLGELVSAQRHAIQAGAVTAGGVVGIAQVVLWVLGKVWGHG